jgi:hypothetical protein
MVLFFYLSFLSGSSLLEGNTLDAAKTEWKEKFLTIYMVCSLHYSVFNFMLNFLRQGHQIKSNHTLLSQLEKLHRHGKTWRYEN